MKTEHKTLVILILVTLIVSIIVMIYDSALDDTPHDIEIEFNAEQNSVNYFVVNGNTDNIEIDTPLDMIDGVLIVYVNDQLVDDERVALEGNKVIVNYGKNIESVKLIGYHEIGGLETEHEPKPEPEQIPLEERLHQEKQDQAKLQTHKEIMIDYRGNQHQIDAINKYREEFEPGYFLEQFVIPNKQNFEQDNVINFVVGQWGYQPEKCLSYNVKGYFKPYDNYDPFYAEKISEREVAQECDSVISSDSNGYIIVNIEPLPGIPEVHQTCTNPGEYRILVKNLKDEAQVEWGYYTCQRDKLKGEPQPWMEIPE